MPSLTALPPRLLSRARADQIATLFTQWPLTTASMLLGAFILTVVMWGTASPLLFATWIGAIALNQAWRLALVRRYRIASPPDEQRLPWGRAAAAGSTIAGALWGVAGVTLFVPGDPGHQALLIVCLFGVILGGINLTSVYKPAFYGFVLTALVPFIVRVAAHGDHVHVSIAGVLLVVLVFILVFGHNLNNLLTQSLAIRYENVDLIAKLQAQTAAADNARAAAEAANRGKTQFLAAASHDLRQPLHALGLFAAALSAKARESEVRDMVASINASVEALERLFSAMMDISKLDAGAVEPRRSAFPVAPLLARSARAFRPLALARGLRLSVVPTSAWVESDPILLERIIANLVSNAVRYTLRGGIVVGVRHRETTLAIEVCDSGIGIACTERERIFDAFYRVETAGMHDGQGMGLGLAIIRRLALLLDHPIEVSSVPGRGSRFTVVVPRAATCVPPQPFLDEILSTPAFAGRVIAVVDDDDAVVEGMRAWLEQSGAVVVTASNGDDVLTALGTLGAYPDLVIADYRLAKSELGTDVIARLRNELGVTIPAVLVSGDSFLLKPVLPEELRTLVEALLRVREPCVSGAVVSVG